MKREVPEYIKALQNIETELKTQLKRSAEGKANVEK